MILIKKGRRRRDDDERKKEEEQLKKKEEERETHPFLEIALAEDGLAELPLDAEYVMWALAGVSWTPEKSTERGCVGGVVCSRVFFI
jgi:hypothetical protein